MSESNSQLTPREIDKRITRFEQVQECKELEQELLEMTGISEK